MEHPPMEAKGEGLAFEAAPDRIHYFAAQTGLRSRANQAPGPGHFGLGSQPLPERV